jgi:arsenate reductase (thioredoxin)
MAALPIHCGLLALSTVKLKRVFMENTQSKIKVLFLCTGNSCRSQMAEGWARHLKGDLIEPFSAGIEKHGLDPRAVRVMAEVGVDISLQYSKAIDELGGKQFDYVITVCDHANESCPLFPGRAKVLHAGFEDPPVLARNESHEGVKLGHYRRVRDQIRTWMENLPALLKQSEG